jgi:ATP-dependent Clp protease ATP-binding subunit ClpC
MYERFTDHARKVMQLANQEAMRFNHEYVGTEHVLLGLIGEGSGVAANVLSNHGVDLAKARPEGEKLAQSGGDPRMPRAKQAIDFAIEEKRRLNHDCVGTEHILLGLIRDRDSAGAQVLVNLGLKLAEVRIEVLKLQGG